MGLNVSKGNMYEFITHTWNTIKGACYHDCAYCYMKRWGRLNPVRFDEKELKTDLGENNFIFVGSSCDMFADGTPLEFIEKTLNHCLKFNNKYLFQSKNPGAMLTYKESFKENTILCTTIESDIFYPEIMRNSPRPENRAMAMGRLSEFYPVFITIEPIMKFNRKKMIELLKACNAEQINIGADSGNNKLPEPSKEDVLWLIDEIKKFSKIEKKRNIERLLK